MAGKSETQISNALATKHVRSSILTNNQKAFKGDKYGPTLKKLLGTELKYNSPHVYCTVIATVVKRKQACLFFNSSLIIIEINSLSFYKMNTNI